MICSRLVTDKEVVTKIESSMSQHDRILAQIVNQLGHRGEKRPVSDEFKQAKQSGHNRFPTTRDARS